jgi:hypothetical protein
MSEKKVLRPPVNDEWKRQASNLINKLVGNIPSDSTAATVSDLKDDLNALLAVLRGLDGK